MFADVADGEAPRVLRISARRPGPRAAQRAARRAGSYCLTAAFSWLPAENFGTLLAGMVTFWPGLRGFTPVRALRACTLNFPKPVKVTSSPFLRASFTDSSTASSAVPASFLDRPDLVATASIKSLLVTCPPGSLVREPVKRPHPLTAVGRPQSPSRSQFQAV